MSQEISYPQELEQKRSYWSTHINSWQASRLSQSQYCRSHELKFHQFVYWRRKLAPKPAAAVRLVQVPTAAVAFASGCGPRSAALRVALTADLSIEVSPGFDPSTLKQLVRALREIR